MLESSEPTTYSPYAEEGTEAHALAEIKLSYMLGQINDTEYATKFDHFRLNSKFYNYEFNDYVNDYCQEVMTIVKEDYKNHEVSVHLEQYVTFEDIVPNGGGTSDVVIVGKNLIHIIDLKFGKGVPVSAIGNTQLRLYALGAIKKYIRECTCTEARMTIIQPRLHDISTDFVSIDELNDWAINYVKPRAELAIAGKGELVPGDHCKFCKLKGKCKALADKQLAIAQAEFEDAVVENNMLEPANMSPEVISRILDIAPKFIDWFKDVEAYAMKTAINDGTKIPGYKLVEGRSTRVIVSPASVIEKLRTAGFSEEDYLKPTELLGITTLEKNIGKKLFNELCEQYIIKPQGKPTLVPESDKRVAIDVKSLGLNGNEFSEEIVYTD
jgi:hypothetical protein